MTMYQSEQKTKSTRKIEFGKFTINVPQSQPLRIGVGSVLVGLGTVGFLPIVGFWMIPVGIMVLAIDVPYFRLMKMRATRWWKHHFKKH